MKLSNKLIIHPLTFFLFFLGLLTGYFKYIIYIFLIVTVHEFGHLVIALLFKRKVISLTLLPFGGLLKMDCLISENICEDLLIAVGGVFFQTIFGFILMFLNHNGFITYDLYDFLSQYNSLLIIFNLIPICPLDGYKILKLVSEFVIPFKKTFLLSSVLSGILFSVIFICENALFKNNILIFCFLFIMSIEEKKKAKYIMVRFYLERLNKNFTFSKKEIKKIDDMYKNKINYIGSTHEKIFLKELFTYKNS